MDISIDPPQPPIPPSEQSALARGIDELERKINFDAWFGKSKVVDRDGNPLVVYHGTGQGEGLTIFDHKYTGQGNDQLGAGFYFTNLHSTASGYTSRRIDCETPKLGGEESPMVIPVFLSLQKPIRMKAKDDRLRDVIHLKPNQAYEIIKLAPDIYDMENSPMGDHFDIWSEGEVTEQMIRDVSTRYMDPDAILGDMYKNNAGKFLEALSKVTGFDGVIKEFKGGERHYVAWQPTQIKSAECNCGRYDKSDPDMTH